MNANRTGTLRHLDRRNLSLPCAQCKVRIQRCLRAFSAGDFADFPNLAGDFRPYGDDDAVRRIHCSTMRL